MEQVGKLLGNDVVTDAIAEKFGEAATGLAKNFLGGGGDQKEEGKEEEKGGGVGLEDALKFVGGEKKDDKGGFNVEDAINLVGGGNKDKEGGGSDVMKTLGNLFG